MIVFENPGEIDVRSISTFGVSVKEGDSPIGFFGTGLKYAIAVLLRTGHSITIYSGENVYTFGVRTESVRGQDFNFVTMAPSGAEAQPIGFTTELGKAWDVWMAYREIACNCKDEGGDSRHDFDQPTPESGTTKILVRGDAFESIFAESHLYILEDAPLFRVDQVEVRGRPGNDFYYRGVRVHQFQKTCLFTYNTLASLELTEDRTVKHHWRLGSTIAKTVLASTDKAFIRACITAKDQYLENDMDYHGWGVAPSAEFLQVVGDCVGDRMFAVNKSAMQVWKDATKKPFAPREIDLTSVQMQSVERALDFCERIGFHIRDAYPIVFVETLGEGGLGLASEGTIYIAERVFHIGGAKQLASTLIEEYIHLRHGWMDMTRELQSFLFEKLVSVGEELVGEPL